MPEKRTERLDIRAPGSSTRHGLHIGMVHLSDFRYDSRIQRQARALAERGDDVELVCLGEPAELRVGRGVIRVHPVPLAKPAGGARAYLSRYAEFLARAGSRLSQLELRRHFDVVEAHNMPDLLTLGTLVPRLRGAGVILNMHDTFPELLETKFGRGPDDLLVRAARVEERVSARLAHRVVTVTDQARALLEARGIGRRGIVVVMNSPDERVFGPPRPPVRIPSDAPVRILYHGGTAPRFGVQVLIAAVARLRRSRREFTLLVLGAGEDRRRLRQQAAELAPGQVEVADEVPFTRIPEELASAHIGVVPTLRDRFTELLLPVKLLEDVHVGLPVVASELPGITSHFSGEELRLVPAGDAVALARAIEELAAAPAAAAARAVRAQERLTSIAWPAQRERYLALVDELAFRTRGA